MSRCITARDLLNFDASEAHKMSTGRLLELYRATRYVMLDWDDYYEAEEGKERAQSLREKQDEIRDQLSMILRCREHIPRKNEGHALRQLMAKHHLNKNEARKYAEVHGVCLNPPRRAQKEKENEDRIASWLVYKIVQKELA